MLFVVVVVGHGAVGFGYNFDQLFNVLGCFDDVDDILRYLFIFFAEDLGEIVGYFLLNHQEDVSDLVQPFILGAFCQIGDGVDGVQQKVKVLLGLGLCFGEEGGFEVGEVEAPSLAGAVGTIGVDFVDGLVVEEAGRVDAEGVEAEVALHVSLGRVGFSGAVVSDYILHLYQMSY